jgi:glycolate oxidase iron-sulfur subunit
LQTSFTVQQLARPEIAEADRILRTCVHYGFCTATCPTYVLFRDENNSPRGRIDLMRAMLEKGGAPEAKTVHHLDRCLSCLACVTTCAVKVDYPHLIDIARAHIETHFRRPLGDRLMRLMLAKTLPYPRRFAAALRLAGFARPFQGLMPGRLGNLIELAAREQQTELIAPQVFAAEGQRRARVLLLAGCVQQVLDGEINAATIRVLAAWLRGGGCQRRRVLRRAAVAHGPHARRESARATDNGSLVGPTGRRCRRHRGERVGLRHDREGLRPSAGRRRCQPRRGADA